MTDRLVFIYNAHSGYRSAIIDIAHKMISPKTYDCNLCALTYGRFSEKTTWKKFKQASPFDMEFLHKDEFYAKYVNDRKVEWTFPLVLVASKDDFKILIDTDELNALKDVGELMALIAERKTA